MNDAETFRRNLAAAIAAAGVSQAEIARRAGTAQANVSRILSGALEVGIPVAGRLADAVGVPLWQLLRPADEAPAASPKRRRVSREN